MVRPSVALQGDHYTVQEQCASDDQQPRGDSGEGLPTPGLAHVLLRGIWLATVGSRVWSRIRCA